MLSEAGALAEASPADGVLARSEPVPAFAARACGHPHFVLASVPAFALFALFFIVLVLFLGGGGLLLLLPYPEASAP
eukprot:13872858-Alexandrium_andersonii.AAC.1